MHHARQGMSNISFNLSRNIEATTKQPSKGQEWRSGGGGASRGLRRLLLNFRVHFGAELDIVLQTAHRRTGRGGRGGSCPPNRLQSRKVGQMFGISRAKSGKLKSQKAPSLLGKQKAVGQYWLIKKRTGTNYVNFVVNLVMYGKGV